MKYNLGDEVEVSFIGTVEQIELNHGKTVYKVNVLGGPMATFVGEECIHPLPVLDKDGKLVPEINEDGGQDR